MKKMNLVLAFAVCTCLAATPAMCEDDIFGNISAAPSTTVEQPTIKVDETVSVRGLSQMNKQENLTTQSLKTTVSTLEAAQTDLRIKLETAKTNYTAVDQEYKRVKSERAALKKIVDKTESRIKNLEKSKKNIQKAIKTD